MISHSTTSGKHLGTRQAPAPKRRPQSGGGSHKTLAVIALLVVVAVFAAGAFLMRPKSQDDAVTPEAFVEQMLRAAEGIEAIRPAAGNLEDTPQNGKRTGWTVARRPAHARKPAITPR